MALPVWGNLGKTQADNETIEEAIARLIQDHEDDPNAHVETGESLQSHKAAAIIDHLAASIVADKIREWEVIKLAGSFERTDFHWITFFESLDGIYQATGADGAVTLNTGYVELSTGALEFGNANIVEEISVSDIFSWDKRRKIRIRVYFSANTNQGISIATGLAENLPMQKTLRFIITDNAAYAYVSDGNAYTQINLSTWIGDGLPYDFEIRYFPAEKVEFYINGVLKGTITTNLPSGNGDAGVLMYIRIGNSAAENKFIRFSYFDFWQEAS